MQTASVPSPPEGQTNSVHSQTNLGSLGKATTVNTNPPWDFLTSVPSLKVQFNPNYNYLSCCESLEILVWEVSRPTNITRLSSPIDLGILVTMQLFFIYIVAATTIATITFSLVTIIIAFKVI